MARNKLRVVVVDDSSLNRRGLATLLANDPDFEVVAVCADGEEGLKAALQLKPDVITLDIQMPRVDGFTFLRLLMAKRPTPVVVISSYARHSDAFQALELGAIDFVARPNRPLLASDPAAAELLAKLKGVRHLGENALRIRSVMPETAKKVSLLAVLGASTGGPPALSTLLGRLPSDLPLAVIVAQHMPEKFTRAFAERLNRSTSFDVAEAQGGEVVTPGRALLAPGGNDLLVVRRGSELVTQLEKPPEDQKYRPSIDRLFESAAEAGAALGLGLMGVVLTGMGADGKVGVAALKKVGAITVAESAQSAVIFGMPKEAISTGKVDRILSLEEIADALIHFGREGR
jgi:two-component system chemotaxis response regulator CheB